MELNFTKGNGLMPAIIQDACTGDVLMLGFMSEASLAETRRTGEAVFFSRSRQRLWRKGEQSGHTLKVQELRADCDADALLLRVVLSGPGVCHEGYRSCFFRTIGDDGSLTASAERVFDPAEVYSKETPR